MPKGKGIPDRWFDYTKVGQQIEGTRFVAFKTPLAGSLGNLPDSQRFSPDDLLECRPNLGLVIDLTNTQRYYSPDLLRGRGLQYAKVRCEGHVVPEKATQQRFFEVVEAFERSNRDPRALVGVHCTHGVNRTGFLICAYMIRLLAVNPRDAIEAFAAARGHPIERLPYVNALHALARDHDRTPNHARGGGINVGSSHERNRDSHSRSNNPFHQNSQSLSSYTRSDDSYRRSYVAPSYARSSGSYRSSDNVSKYGRSNNSYSNNAESSYARPRDSSGSNRVVSDFVRPNSHYRWNQRNTHQNDSDSGSITPEFNSARQNDFHIRSNYFTPSFSHPKNTGVRIEKNTD